MPRPLPRAFKLQEQALDEAKVARIVAEAGEREEPESMAGVTAAGDVASGPAGDRARSQRRDPRDEPTRRVAGEGAAERTTLGQRRP